MRMILILLVLFTACEKEVSVSQTEPDAPMGSILFSTYPEGMKIFIDGKNSGYITPDTVQFLTPGYHEVLFRKDLFIDYSEQFEIIENETNSLFTDFRNVPGVNGSIKVGATVNGSLIELNDSLINLVTPAIIKNLFPGFYKIKASTFECRPDSSVIIVQSGKQSIAHLAPEDTSIWVRYTVENSAIPTNYLGSITPNGHRGFWIEGSNVGLISYNKGQISYPIYEFPQLPSGGILKMLLDSKNRLWISSPEGVTKFDGTTIENYSSANTELNDNTILDMTEGPNGAIWFSTVEGVTVFNGENWLTYDKYNSDLTSNLNLSIAVSTTNTVLIGTNAAGLIRLKNGIMTRYTKINSPLGGNTPLRIIPDKNGGFFINISTRPKQDDVGGLFYFKNGAFTEIDFPASPDLTVNSMFLDKNSNLWLATNQGIFRYNKDFKFQFYTKYSTPLTSDIFNDCIQDLDGNLWFTSVNDGLIKLKVHKLPFE